MVGMQKNGIHDNIKVSDTMKIGINKINIGQDYGIK